MRVVAEISGQIYEGRDGIICDITTDFISPPKRKELSDKHKLKIIQELKKNFNTLQKQIKNKESEV